MVGPAAVLIETNSCATSTNLWVNINTSENRPLPTAMRSPISSSAMRFIDPLSVITVASCGKHTGDDAATGPGVTSVRGASSGALRDGTGLVDTAAD